MEAGPYQGVLQGRYYTLFSISYICMFYIYICKYQGAVGCVEECREESIKAILNYIQGLGRGYTSRMEYKKLIYKRNMIPIMQRNMKKYLFFRDWTWYFLVNGTKRFIGQEDMESVIANLEEEAAVACKAYDEVVEVRDRLDGENTQVGPISDCCTLWM